MDGDVVSWMRLWHVCQASLAEKMQKNEHRDEVEAQVALWEGMAALMLNLLIIVV